MEPGNNPEDTATDIVIIGAGFGGIGAGAILKRAGIRDFTIIDKAPNIGGTWWHNQYPGAEVDTPSCAYSFPFKRHDWTRTHAKQAELLAYLEETVDEYAMRPNLRLEVGVERAVWNEATHEYVLTLDTGETLRCNVLICATGFLNIPRYPSWPGLDEFEGPKFHTARWQREHDLAGKTVSVVGTGSSAAQLVSELANIAGKLHVYQREPGWILPKGERDLNEAERAKLRNRIFYDLARLRFFWMAEKSLWRAGVYTPGAPQNEATRQLALGYIEAEFADRPDLKKAVTPTYPMWGKRLVLDSRFYPALKHDNVELIPRAVHSVTRTGVVDADGVERETDVIVFATGFEPTNYLGTIEIEGRRGETLRQYWNDEPRGFFGVTVPGFPNLFIIYGPGTNGGEIVSNLLAQARYAMRAIRLMRRRGATAVEVKRSWADIYHAWLQSRMAGTAWVESTNYFTVGSGKVVTQWPYSATVYRLLMRALWRPSLFTRRLGIRAPTSDFGTGRRAGRAVLS